MLAMLWKECCESCENSLTISQLAIGYKICLVLPVGARTTVDCPHSQAMHRSVLYQWPPAISLWTTSSNTDNTTMNLVESKSHPTSSRPAPSRAHDLYYLHQRGYVDSPRPKMKSKSKGKSSSLLPDPPACSSCQKTLRPFNAFACSTLGCARTFCKMCSRTQLTANGVPACHSCYSKMTCFDPDVVDGIYKDDEAFVNLRQITRDCALLQIQLHGDRLDWVSYAQLTIPDVPWRWLDKHIPFSRAMYNPNVFDLDGAEELAKWAMEAWTTEYTKRELWM